MLSWVADAALWMEGHPVVAEYPTATVMAHAVLVLLAWYTPITPASLKGPNMARGG